MISFDQTDLHIIELEGNDGTIARIYLLLDKTTNQPFDTDAFVEEMDHVLEISEKKPKAFDDFLDRMNVLEIFDQGDIEELIDEGFLDPEDLHQSLYDYCMSEDDDLLFEDEESDPL